jgi:hypothetical protein
MHRLIRLLQAAIVAVLLTTVPVATVSACSCAFLGYPEAIATSDVAFVGTVVGAEEPGVMPIGGFPEAAYAFDVERGKQPLASPFTVHSVVGNGANCGLEIDVGQRWLVLASMEDGVPKTSLCSGSTLFEGLDEATRAQVEPLLAEEPSVQEEVEDGLMLPPGPVVAFVGAVLLVAIVSVVAFRRSS